MELLLTVTHYNTVLVDSVNPIIPLRWCTSQPCSLSLAAVIIVAWEINRAADCDLSMVGPVKYDWSMDGQ